MLNVYEVIAEGPLDVCVIEGWVDGSDEI